MAGTRIAVETKGLCKVFGSRVVLSQVDLQIAEGESVALRGANGTGKTTLLRCLASLLRPSSGEVRWFGHPAGVRPAARRLMALVAHETFLYPHLSLRENLIFAARMGDVGQPGPRADQWLREVGLQHQARRLPAQISNGMRRRLAVARAVLHDPRILLLDEPFSGLDAAGIDWLLDLLLRLRRQGRTLCFTTHDEEKIRQLAERTFRIGSGRLEEVEPPGDAENVRRSISARAA